MSTEMYIKKIGETLGNKSYLLSTETQLSKFILIFASLIQTLITHFSEFIVSGLFVLY